MDHSHMDHGHMGHGDMDHGDMGHGDSAMCSMNMLFTWDTTNLCIVFRSWRVTSLCTLALSLVAVAALTAGYEAVREVSRRVERQVAAEAANLPHDERRSLLFPGAGGSVRAQEQRGRVLKAALYGIQVFYSFFIMLLFMTYNGWVMLAVGVGAFIGYLLFGSSSIDKSAACH